MATVKVNIGSGTTVAPGWINYDISIYIALSKYNFLKKILYAFRLIEREAYETAYPPSVVRNITRRDVRKGLPLLDESVDFIFCSHFLEHIAHSEAIKVLKECYRVLKLGGWIRVVIPDLRILASKYLEGDLRFFEVREKDELSQAFIKSLMVLDERPLIKKLVYGLISYNIHQHYYMYDFDSLESLLNSCGFSRVEKRRFKEGITPDIDKLEIRPFNSLQVEAQKR